MAAAAGAVGTKQALSLASAAISAFGAIQQGAAANRAAKFESAQLRIQADRDRQIAEQDAQDFDDNESRRRATARARIAGSGVTFEGTPLAVLSDLAGEAQFNKLRILSGGETSVIRAENQAANRRVEGRSAQRSGFFRAGASLLTGASKFKRGP